MTETLTRLARVALVALLCALAPTAAGGVSARRAAPAAAPPTNTFDLRDFGAVGDGTTDDAPALQAALDALAAAGGGTLHVPAGRYVIASSVFKDFQGLADSVSILGVPSDTVVDSNAPPHLLATGLGLASEFYPRTGRDNSAIWIRNLPSLLVKDLAFVGTPDVFIDAAVTLGIEGVEQAVVRHCEFYGLSTIYSGAIVFAWRSGLAVEQSKFLGSVGSSGVYVPVIQNLEWKSVSVSDVVFVDYGLRPELYGKTGYAAPYSWVNVANAAAVTPDSPRREVSIRRVFLDEGGFVGLSSLPFNYPTPPTAPIDLFYVTGLRMNVSNLGTTGHYLDGLNAVLVEDSRYGWSHNADSAIYVLRTGDAILDRVRTEAAATRLRADARTSRLTVINSVYEDLASAARATRVIETEADEDDPVWYVRREFVEALGREPDPAGHYYWTRRLLDCADADAACVAAARAALADYLGDGPAPNFAIGGVLADEFGRPLAGAAVALSGSQAVSTVTDAEGRYRFSNLPTSGVYTVSASKRHYTFDAPRVVTTPAGDVLADVGAAINRHAVRGRVTDLGGAGVAGAAVTLSGTQAAETTTDAAGNYSLPGLAAGGSYTVSASSPRYTFAPASLSFTDLASDRAADFTATPRFHTIAGRLAKSDSSGVAGVTVTLSGSRTATATTDAQGNYSFADLPRGGSYTVTPAALFGHTFSPASQTFDNVTADKAANFTAVTTNYRITGRVAEGGTGLPGVTVSLSGSHAATATTDSSGNYTLNVPAHGSYTVTTSKQHYTFAPTSASFNAVSADRTADFSATLNRHKISGRVARTSGAAMAGVTVTLSGGQSATATTDASGNYSFTSLPAGGNYTVTPSRPGYDFAPGNRALNNLGSDQTADFGVTPSDVQIAGRVTAGGAPLASATVTLSGTRAATATTDAQGDFSFTVSSEGSYTVAASKQHYTFAPAGASFTNPTSNRTADFTATLVNYTISGRVTDGAAPLAAATVTLSGAQTATATADAQGNYSFSVPAEGDYTVAASKRHYTFAPASRSIAKLGANQTADFAATLNRHSISGRVTKQGGGALAGAAVTLSGGQTSTATTDASGNYSFTSLPAGRNYTVSVARAHYDFASASQTFQDLAADRAADFTGAPVNYRVGGRVTEGGAGLSGVTINLSGSQTATATTDADGRYSFTLPAEGAYAVTPSKRHYTFAPASAEVASLDGNKTADFTATLNRHAITGRVTTPDGSALQGATVTLGGAQSATATTDASGSFAFDGLPAGGTYTVAVARAHYAFTTQTQTFDDLAADQTADFSGALVSYRVVGRVTLDGAGVGGVTVAVTGSRTETATTDPAGNYSFTLPAEGDYTVTPTKRHYTFAPAAATFSSLDGDKTTDFTAGIAMHRVSGRVTEKGAAVPGVSVSLAGTHPALGAQAAQAVTAADGTYSLAAAAGGDYVLTPSKQNYTFDPAAASFAALGADRTADFAATQRTVVEFSAAAFGASEGAGSHAVTVTRGGDTSGETTVTYTAEDVSARQGHDLGTVVGQLTFAPGETTKTITLFVTDDVFVEGPESVTLRLAAGGETLLGGGGAASFTIEDNDVAVGAPNPVDDARFFVRQHYLDFLNRAPDQAGLDFWAAPIEACGADAACAGARRAEASAAFFLSIEFQETGFLIHRLYKASYGRAPRRVGEFLLDSRLVSDGVAVGAPGWAEKLAANKRAFYQSWVRRPEFRARFDALSDEQFADALVSNMGLAPDGEERAALLAALRRGAPRHEVLAEAAEGERFSRRETRPAFVLMQYFGYLQRNPDEAPDTNLDGYNFWLRKLEDNGGDWRAAEMVRAFIVSIEYRHRFGQ